MRGSGPTALSSTRGHRGRHYSPSRTSRANLFPHKMLRASVEHLSTRRRVVPHSVEVQADSLYEAVALAVAEVRADNPAAPGPMTEFTVSIQPPAIEHRIRLSQVSRWAKGDTREGSAGITKRQRIRAFWKTASRNPRSNLPSSPRPSRLAPLVLNH